jgi:hypothetical protein
MGKSGGDDPAAKDLVSTSFSEEKPGTRPARSKKTSVCWGKAVEAEHSPSPRLTKVFSFFFSKKNRFLRLALSFPADMW